MAVSLLSAEQESEELMDQGFVGIVTVRVHGLQDFKIEIYESLHKIQCVRVLI